MRTLKLKITPEDARRATAERRENEASFSMSCIGNICLIANLLKKLDNNQWWVGVFVARCNATRERIVMPDCLKRIVSGFTFDSQLDDSLKKFEEEYPDGYEVELEVEPWEIQQ